MKYVFKLSFLPLIFFIYLSSAFGQPKMIVDLNDGAHREYMLSELRTMQLQPANQSSILQIFKKGYDCVITPSGIIDSVYFDFIGADSSLMSVSYAGIINSYKLSEIDSIKFSSVSYALKAQTKMLDTVNVTSLIRLDANKIVLKKSMARLENIMTGDIIVYGISGITPQGLLRKIKKITAAADSVEIETENVKLTDAIENCVIAFRKNLIPKDTLNTKKHTGLLMLQSQSEKEFAVQMNSLLLHDYDNNLNTKNDQISYTGSYTFTSTMYFCLVIKDGLLKQYIMSNHQEQKLDYDAAATLTGYKSEPAISIFHAEFPPVLTDIPFISVTPGIDIICGYDLNLKESASSNLNSNSESIVGIVNDYGSVKPIAIKNYNIKSRREHISSAGRWKSYIGSQLNITLDNNPDGCTSYTNMFNYFELNAVILDDPWWKLWGGIRANAGISSVWLGCTNEQTNIINEKILLTEAGNLKILSVKPDTSDIGQEVAISGRGFGKDRIANLVYFNSIPAVEYSLWNDTLITVKVPLGAVSGKIYVSVNGINSNTLDIRIFVPSRPFGQLWAWGNNEFGQLGDSTNILSYEPVKIKPLWNCVAASAGMSYSLAINTYGKLYSWGNNSGGELGNGYTGNRNNPGQIGNAEDKWSFISASAFYSNSLGVTEEGWMLGWGRNDYGQVGDGTRQPKYSPIQIWGHDWAKVSVRGFHTLAITTDGKLYAWGRNNYGQLGDSSFFDSLIPERIGKDQTWVSVSAGNSHSLAISSEGRLYGWGLNNKGQVGNNSSETTIVPTRLGNGTNWAVVCAGDDNSFAITKDGKLYGWGDNYHYQLGGNNNYDKAAPTLIVSNVKWAKVSAGSWHTMAITTDGKLYGWGDNTYGQIGDGTDILRTFPERVGSDNGWLDVSAGNIHTLGIRK